MRLRTDCLHRLTTRRGARRTALVPLLTAGLVLVAGPAWAYWATAATGAGVGATATMSAPGTVTAVAGAGTAHLTWAASTLSTGTPVSGYVVTRSGQSMPVCGSASSPLTGTSCDDRNVPPGTYAWTVTAVYRTWTASAVSNSATVTAGTAGTIAVSSGSGQSTRVGTAFSAPLVAVVRDGSGNPVPGISVTFTAAVGGASGSFPGAATVSVTTNASGLATAPTFTANTTAGSYTVSATATGVATPAAFPLTNTAAAASTVSVSSGSSQSATVGTAFGSPLVAKVVDAYNNPVPGVVVTFSAPPPSGATGTFPGPTATATGTTGADGLATAPTFTANTKAGSYSVSAGVAGVA
ncbi:MAG: hypothetical protein ACTHJ6_06135, partial [Oryzihumus sp.]